MRLCMMDPAAMTPETGFGVNERRCGFKLSSRGDARPPPNVDPTLVIALEELLYDNFTLEDDEKTTKVKK